MSRVYSWMTVGLSVTGAVAWSVGRNEELALAVVQNRPLFWALVIAQLGAVVVLSTMIRRLSSVTAALIYSAYAALTGVTLSVIFLMYTGESIVQVFGLTAFSFAGLSAFGFATKRDLGPVGSFCAMGLFGMIGFGLLSVFFPSLMTAGASFVYSLVGIVVFAGLTAYDTQKIKAMRTDGNGAIHGALTLYLDFINLFLSLLRLMGKRR